MRAAGRMFQLTEVNAHQKESEDTGLIGVDSNREEKDDSRAHSSFSKFSVRCPGMPVVPK